MIDGPTFLNKLAGVQKEATQDLYGPSSEQDVRIEKMGELISHIESLQEDAEGTRKATQELSAGILPDYKIPSKISIAASDVAKLSAPHSYGYLYLGEKFAEAGDNLSQNFTYGLRKYAKKDTLKKEDGKSGSGIFDSIKLGLLSSFGINDKKAKEMEKKGGLFGMIGASIIGGLTGTGAAFTIKEALKKGTWVKPLLKGATSPVALLATGIVTTTIAGIRGYFKADSWGTSKLSGVLGSVFGGASGGGIKSMFAGMGRWATLGAVIGSVVPAVGTLAGGIVGAAFGGIMGLLGGKKLAKAFDGLGSWVSGLWSGMVEGIKSKWDTAVGNTKQFGSDISDGIKQALADIKTKAGEFFTNSKETTLKILGVVGTMFVDLKDGLVVWASEKWADLKAGFGKVITGVSSFYTDTKDKMVLWFTEKWANLKTGFGKLITGVSTFYTDTKDKMIEWTSEKWDGLKTGFGSVVSGIASFFTDTKDKMVLWSTEKWANLKTGFGKVITGVSSFYTNTKDKMTEWTSEKWADLKTGFGKVITGVSTFYTNTKDKMVLWSTEKWANLKTGFGNVVEGVSTFYTNTKDKMTEWGKEKSTEVKEGFHKITDGVKTWFSGNVLEEKEISTGFESITSSIGSWMSGVGSDITTLGTSAVQSVKDKFTGITDGVKDWLKGRENDIAVDGAVSALSIKGKAKNIFDSVAGWFKERGDAVDVEAAKNTSLVSGLQTKLAGMFSFDMSILSPTAISTLIKDKLLGPIEGFFSNISSFFNTLKSYFDDGFFSGMKKLTTALWSGDFGVPQQSPEKVKDAVFKTTSFQLDKAGDRGSLFGDNNRGIELDPNDDLYLMASTNPAKDALTKSVDRLNELIVLLAQSIDQYKPQITNTIAPMQQQQNSIRALLEMN